MEDIMMKLDEGLSKLSNVQLFKDKLLEQYPELDNDEAVIYDEAEDNVAINLQFTEYWVNDDADVLDRISDCIYNTAEKYGLEVCTDLYVDTGEYIVSF